VRQAHRAEEFQLGNYEGALKFFRQELKYRPNDASVLPMFAIEGKYVAPYMSVDLKQALSLARQGHTVIDQTTLLSSEHRPTSVCGL